MLGYKRRTAKWWTRERVITALKKFYDEFGFCPTNTEHYAEYQRFTGKIVAGRVSNQGHENKYPSVQSLTNIFATMREAWEACGFDMNRHWVEWTEQEDYFLLEATGVLSQEEIGDCLDRTRFSIKRRLYSLGRINTRNRWGVSETRAAKLLGVSESVIRRYRRDKIIPFFKGNKTVFLNPADFPKIDAVDWQAVAPNTELSKIVMHALQLRLVKILKFGSNWRNYEIYGFHDFKMTNWYERRKKAGICVECKLQTSPGAARCLPCRTTRNEYLRQQYQNQKRVKNKAILLEKDKGKYQENYG